MSTFRQTQYAVSPMAGFADAGQYFTSSNPTPGTALNTIAAQATLADTAPFFTIQTSTKSVVLDFLRVICAAPGTAGTALRWAVKTDGLKTNPTGGTTLTPVNTNTAGQAAASAAFGGPLVAAAATGTVRLVDHGLVRPVIPVVGDVYLWKFGVATQDPAAALITSGTAITATTFSPPAVVVGPNSTFQFHLWLPSQSAASSFEIVCGFAEFV